MTHPSDYGVILTTVPARDAAQKIAHALIDARLAACIQAMPIESWYRWEGAVQNDDELLLLIKTKCACFDDAIAAIRRAHPYDVPEIVCLPFSAGFEGYFGWMEEVTGR